jgi:NADPH:quinone reductase-like Zn-dependent oxidoreductase
MLQIIEDELRPPAADEARVQVLAAAVSLPDVEARYGRSPFPPKVPFTPAYAIVGRVAAVGGGVTQAQMGGRVAARSFSPFPSRTMI